MSERLFIDATYTLSSGKSSGIERVVRNILHECHSMGKSGRIPTPQLMVSLNGGFYETSEAHVASFRRTAAMHANALATTPRIYRALAGGFCTLAHFSRFRKWLLPQAGHLGIFKLAHSLRESAVRRKIYRSCRPVQFRPGDLVLLPDAYWVNRLRSSVWPAAAQAREQGALVATVLYDLIPLTHPEFVGLKRRDSFLDYLKKAATNSDLLVAISDTVRDQVADYLPTIAGPTDSFCQDIRSFQLGAELQSASGHVREKLIELFTGPCTPYIMVATFDPRKNHSYLLDAFDSLWQQRPDLRLCLIGRVGSRCDEVIARMQSHPGLNRQLFHFDDLSDAELQHCYRGARGVVFPSIVEGFGLPIVESLWFGKKTFVSDTPIHREVGREACTYFSLNDPLNLVEQITSWESALAAGALPSIPVRKPVTWRDSASQIMNHCFQALEAREAVRPCERRAA
jgi:alpha-1,2-rhamnosyltransferase